MVPPRIPRDILLGFVLVCALSLGLMSVNWMRWLDREIYDAQIGWLRANAPSAMPQDVVVIGMDEAAFESLPEPYALWHRYIAAVLNGLAEAKPAVVGLAAPLPVRSYDFLIKGIDTPLLEAIRRLRETTPLVIGQPMGIGKSLRPVAPEIIAAAGEGALASLAICEDLDGVVRRIHQRRCHSEEKKEPFAHVMAKHLGREGSPSGQIDYSAGSEIEYIPLQLVYGWATTGQVEQLRTAFGGRVVVIASLLPTEVRYRLPVPLAGWERGSRTEPAAVVHVQALRSLLGRGLIERVPDTRLSLYAALAALAWFGRSGMVKLLALVILASGILGASTASLWQGESLHTGTLLTCLTLVALARYAWDAARHYGERKLLRAAFGGHVSAKVMRALLGGRLHLAADGARSRVTVLFADIRGFTARSAQSQPATLIGLLNRYHNAVSLAVQLRGGATDKLIGDGILATFGLPLPLDAPERNALEAAQDILLRVTQLNAELTKAGEAPIEVGIGIHCGEVLAGYVGSDSQRDFTVIGEPVNVAMKLETLTKTAGYPVVCSHEVAAAVGFSGGLIKLPTENPLASPLWGWHPPLLQRIGKSR